MKYQSTRELQTAYSLSEALTLGLSPDGGLLVPDQFPTLPADRFHDSELTAAAKIFLKPFFAADPLGDELDTIVSEALNFPIPLVPLAGEHDLQVLELFHGPTAAFKDVGARFLAACLARLRRQAAQRLTILVATSGDTGGAVAAAFHHVPNIEVVVLYPKGLVSPRQELQLTCWDDNIRTLAVHGTFDDCQRMVKAAFAEAERVPQRVLSSANSINIGRLLPQACYYVMASLATYRRTGQFANFVVPSGNLGNVLAAVWARKVGLPINRLQLAFNANRTVVDYLESGDWQPRASIATLASAMDVGNPSNMERLRALYPDIAAMNQAIAAQSVDDATIQGRIVTDLKHYQQIWCPHTATAAEVYERLKPSEKDLGPWILVATAHPAKFPETVEPLIGASIAIPASLSALLNRPRQVTEIPADVNALLELLQA
jgi:threonine synthase